MSRLKKRVNIYGEMAERSKAAVLKTVDLKGSWGSNPYLSAKIRQASQMRLVVFIL